MKTEIIEQKTIQAIPTLRFKEFDHDWKKEFLKNLAELITKGTTPNKFSITGINYVKLECLEGVNIIKSKCLFIDKETHLNLLSRSILKMHDLLFAIAGATVGKVGIVTEDILPANTNQALAIIRLKNKEYLQFILQILQSARMKKYIYKSVSVGAQPNLNLQQIGNFSFFLPSLPEQQKIATFLSAVDKKIRQLTCKKELLETYKKGVMQQLFSQEIRFKDENGREFPGWERKKLGEIAERKIDKNVSDNVKFVLTNSATQGIISQDDYFDRDIANQNNLQGYYIVSKDDFVYNPRISIHAPVGPIKRNKLKEGIMSPLYSVFRFTRGKLLFFEYFFETINWHRYLKNVANFGARHDRMNITNVDFYKMPIPFPCIEEQQKIADFLSAIDRKIEAVQQQITKTQSFKKGLLQQMFV